MRLDLESTPQMPTQNNGPHIPPEYQWKKRYTFSFYLSNMETTPKASTTPVNIHAEDAYMFCLLLREFINL